MFHRKMQDKNIQQEADRLLLTNYAPASVVINAEMEIVHVRGHTSSYLELAPGQTSLNLIQMAREGLRLDLRAAIHTARKNNLPVTKEGLQVDAFGVTREVRITVHPLKELPAGYYFLVLFEEMTPSLSAPPLSEEQASRANKRGPSVRRIAALELELAATQVKMQGMIEACDTTNEELQTMNEEIRSANEELQTSQEELQATNQEVATTNLELERSNEQLTIAQKRADAIVETVREPLVVLTEDLHIERANAAFYQFFEVVPQETEGCLLYDLGNGQWDIPSLRMLLEQAYKSSQLVHDFEVEHTFPLIGRKTMLLNACRITHEYKPAEVHRILLAIEDITERKQAEAALRESEMRFRGLVESNIIGITVVNLEGNIREANEAFLSLVGYTQEDLVAGRMQWMTMTPPEDQERVGQAMKQLMTTGTFQPFEKEFVRKDGKRVTALMGGTLFHLESPPTLAICFILDLTARKEMERQKDLMLGMTSHELKTPLTALKGTFQLLQRRAKRLGTREDNLSPEASSFLADLSERLAASARQVDIQAHLINDLLDVSRITAHTLKLEMAPCDLVPIVCETVEDLRVTAPERSLLLEVPEHATVTVLADRNRIGQVVINYVTNAIRYSSSDQPIHIGLTIQGDSVRVWVRDKGPGLTEEAQKELWQRFHQVKGVPVQSGSGKGLGLGLYICQTLIAQHQGEVGVESTPGEGSTFWFTLPLVT